jgi:hydroxyethylthiazole kinase-like uncharacterized protein yjeF
MRLPSATTRAVTGEEMAAIDRAAIDGRGIPSLTLMERAGTGAAAAILSWWKTSLTGSATAVRSARGASAARGPAPARQSLVLCGRGNNGGDGMVVARRLRAAGFLVRVAVAAAEENLSRDARAMYEACAKARVPVTFLPEPRAWGPGSEIAFAAGDASFLVDALLGTGSKGPPRGAVAAAIELIDRAGKPVVSIDIPSGIDASTGHVEIPSVRADLTVSLALPKIGLMIEPGRERAGRIETVDIGIPEDLVHLAPPRLVVADAAWARALLPARAPDAHKGSVGRVLFVGGSAGMIGAMSLASESALRAGAGYAVAAVPASCVDVLEARVAEVVKRGVAETAGRTLARQAIEAILAEAMRADAVAIGPGLSRDPDSMALVRDLVDQVEGPVVLDADGLNAFEGRPLRRRHGPIIVTPHFGEAARLAGSPVAVIARDPVGWARRFAEESGAIVCVKSVPMVTVVPGEPAILNATGNPGMATAGAGDVLTGTVAAFVAQGLEAGEAAAVGCFVHGLAGDVAARRAGRRGMLAGDIRDSLPAALVALESGALNAGIRR